MYMFYTTFLFLFPFCFCALWGYPSFRHYSHAILFGRALLSWFSIVTVQGKCQVALGDGKLHAFCCLISLLFVNHVRRLFV